MRISDWSSDLCSSDLPHLEPAREQQQGRHGQSAEQCQRGTEHEHRHRDRDQSHEVGDKARDARREQAVNGVDRSEEHTSELQSLMRISYAVFCLKKKKRKTHVWNNNK